MNKGVVLDLDLFEPCRIGDVALLKERLSAGADPSLLDEYGWSCINWAYLFRKLKCVKLLLENSTDPDTCDKDGDTILHIASQKNHIKYVKLLLEYKANPNTQSDNTCSALNCASGKGNTECVKLLLKAGADPNLCDKHGQSPLLASVFHNNVESIKLLLEYGANPYLQSNSGVTGFDVANGKCMVVLENWKTYLPPWNRYTTAARYPIEFNKLAFAWLSSSKLPRDLRYLVLPKLAEKWKLK